MATCKDCLHWGLCSRFDGTTRFYGTTGCNSFFGEFKTSDKKEDITLTNVGATKKLCEDMTVEDAIFSAFIKVASVNYDNEKMQLKDESGNEIKIRGKKNVYTYFQTNPIEARKLYDRCYDKLKEKEDPFVKGFETMLNIDLSEKLGVDIASTNLEEL